MLGTSRLAPGHLFFPLTPSTCAASIPLSPVQRASPALTPPLKSQLCMAGTHLLIFVSPPPRIPGLPWPHLPVAQVEHLRGHPGPALSHLAPESSHHHVLSGLPSRPVSHVPTPLHLHLPSGEDLARISLVFTFSAHTNLIFKLLAPESHCLKAFSSHWSPLSPQVQQAGSAGESTLPPQKAAQVLT